jgi:hypothetical protein
MGIREDCVVLRAKSRSTNGGRRETEMAKMVGFSFGCGPSRFDNGVGSGKMVWGSGDVIDDVRTKGKLECSRVGAALKR